MNQREIKFRAWSKEFKMMSEVFTLAQLIGKKVVNMDFVNTIFIQYTGLQDRNKKEVFEGDIVKWGDHCEFCRENPVRIAEVKFSPSIQFHAYNVKTRYENAGYVIFDYGNFAYKDTKHHLEIIGNIYSNPELINNKT